MLVNDEVRQQSDTSDLIFDLYDPIVAWVDEFGSPVLLDLDRTRSRLLAAVPAI